jgi:prepilin-type N-terminal cleavage/methylation domain-containing protein
MNTQYILRKLHRGFTIIEVMIAVAIIIIIALGTMSFQYQGIRHSRLAEAQLSAARLGQLLLEDWKSTGGAADYNPSALGLGFQTTVYPENGGYKITIDNQTFYVQLVTPPPPAPVSSGSNPDPVAGVALNQLRLIVSWRKDFGSGAIRASDPTLTFTTFVRVDS